MVTSKCDNVYHSKAVCEIQRDTALYNSIYTVDGVYEGVMRCCISPYFTYGFAVCSVATAVYGFNA